MTTSTESIEALIVDNRSGLGGDSVMDDSIDDEAMVFYVLLKTNISVYTREVILT